ncbi:FAD-dependent oxidoreductase [Rhizorhabdus histidinilytica]
MRIIDALVVGAGVIGLSVGRKLSISGHETIIIDGEEAFGTWTSARNSEVIHAGIYYPAGSLKAGLCTRGRELLYRYCSDRGFRTGGPARSSLPRIPRRRFDWT